MGKKQGLVETLNEAAAFVMALPGADIPVREDGRFESSAAFGHAFIVEIEWSTDYDGRRIDITKESPARTLHGPFRDAEEAAKWIEDYPEDEDIVEMTAITLNLVRPSVPA